MRGNQVLKLSDDELWKSFSKPGWSLVGGPGTQGIQLPAKIGGVRLTQQRFSFEPAPSNTWSHIDLHNCAIISPNEYTIEFHRLLPKEEVRTKVQGGGTHTIRTLQMWLRFINEPMKLEAEAKAAAHKARTDAETATTQAKLKEIGVDRT